MPVRVWLDEDRFFAKVSGDGWSIVYSFPVKELAEGASLSRMMNVKVRETIKTYNGLIPKEELQERAKEARDALRGIIEPYFAERGIGE